MFIHLPFTGLGVIEFEIETAESTENLVTAETVHSETPVYTADTVESMMQIAYTNTLPMAGRKSKLAGEVGDAGKPEWSGNTL